MYFVCATPKLCEEQKKEYYPHCIIENHIEFDNFHSFHFTSTTEVSRLFFPFTFSLRVHAHAPVETLKITLSIAIFIFIFRWSCVS